MGNVPTVTCQCNHVTLFQLADHDVVEVTNKTEDAVYPVDWVSLNKPQSRATLERKKTEDERIFNYLMTSYGIACL